MLTGEIRNRVDKIWDAFWSGGVSNPLEVIEHVFASLQHRAFRGEL
jgi:type I restriction enzyme M protein